MKTDAENPSGQNYTSANAGTGPGVPPVRSNAEKLAPCPFCGSINAYVVPVDTDGMRVVRCGNCSARTVAFDAVGEWNRRVSQPAAQPDALHASAPTGYKCADCQMDQEACPACYAAWWQKRHPNTFQVGGQPASATVRVPRVPTGLMIEKAERIAGWYPRRAREVRAMWAAMLAAAPAEQPSAEPVAQKPVARDFNNWKWLVVRDIQELPDRDSPDDWPEAMLVTSDELIEIITRHAPPSGQAERISGNYIVDDDTYPRKVTFANGRVVKIVGEGHLAVDWEKS